MPLGDTVNAKYSTHDSRIARFFKLESASGILLIFAALLAIIFANSGLADFYDKTLHTKISILYGDAGFSKTLLHWINDGLMAIFFFLVGLEIKEEFALGHLSSREQMTLPFAAAIGGMAIPALVYVYITKDVPALIDGWAIPAATDIAFAIGLLALLGSRIPLSAKILLTAIAIIDDIGAVIVIALFYTSDLSVNALYIACGAIIMLGILNRMRCAHIAAYVLVGMVLWASVLKSGVHATLAGVITALFIPLNVKNEDGHELVEHLEHTLHPWVSFLIVPLFAFANAGVSLEGLSLDVLLSPVTLGIFCGLFIGKQLGIFTSIFLIVKSGFAKKPQDINWLQLYGLSAMCGIGFTMSLFIGGLAFDNADLETQVRLGVLTGSLASAVFGCGILYFAHNNKNKQGDKKS